MSDRKINILLVDDYKVIRDVFKRTIADEQDMFVAGEASNIVEAFKLLKTNEMDIVLLDIHLPDTNGIETLKKFKKRKPALPVLMVSGLSEEIYAIKSIEAGSSGFVSKENAFDELIPAIRMAISGNIFYNPSFE